MVFGLFSRNKPTIAETAVDVGVSVNPPPPTPSPEPEPGPQQLQENNDDDDVVESTAELYAFVKSIPPKTLHSYTVSKLRKAKALDVPIEANVIRSLVRFFETLEPPPTLHCVRCHKNFFEIDNTDTSCLIQHDDDSAEVERVGTTGKGKDRQAAYETLWGCCGNTVPGDGDMGPPDGWCYEGKHTTDVKRARFRADSTPSSDRLTSCARMRCALPLPSSTATFPIAGSSSSHTHSHTHASSSHGHNTRKRLRSDAGAGSASCSSSSAGSVADDSGIDEIVGGRSRRTDMDERARKRRKKRMRVKRASPLPGVDPDTEDGDGAGDAGERMDVDEGETTATASTAVKTSKAKAKPRSTTGAARKPKSTSTTSAPRRKKARPTPNEEDGSVEKQPDLAEEQQLVTTSPAGSPVRGKPPPKRRKPKSKVVVVESPTPEVMEGGGNVDARSVPTPLGEIVPSSVGEEDWDWKVGGSAAAR